MKRAPSHRAASASSRRAVSSTLAPRRAPAAAEEREVPVRLSVERGPHPGIRRAEILRRIEAMIVELQLQQYEVSFLLTDDKRIHQLNKIYRNKDRPTDVLAFAMQEGELAELAGGVLGDVIVSVPTAKKQADERGVGLVDEVTMLLAHGLLHLLGWDHRTAAEDRRMRAETDRLCRAARPAGQARAAGRASASSPGAAPRSSKGGAKRALSGNRSAVQRPARGGKVQARHQVKARRSRKG
ncbi:MAG: rRNA maturation RNase YbeY [Labilithrix sp.]|nr:rRNA maturation RNase YbeY [Labilithrix sp.]